MSSISTMTSDIMVAAAHRTSIIVRSAVTIRIMEAKLRLNSISDVGHRRHTKNRLVHLDDDYRQHIDIMKMSALVDLMKRNTQIDIIYSRSMNNSQTVNYRR
jgi:hypothetical protein